MLGIAVNAADRLARPLPPELADLPELALDLRLTGSRLAVELFESLDPETWSRIRNPWVVLQNAPREALERAARNEDLKGALKTWRARRERYLEAPGWYGDTHGEGEPLKRVAYFSMEFGLGEALPIYSGGLGMLAGDHLKSASDLNVPLVGVGLLFQQGYFRQVLGRDGRQLEAFPFNDPESLPIIPVMDGDGRWPRVSIELPGRTLFLRVWQARVGRVTLYLLDSNHPLNNPWDRGITAQLYAAGQDSRLLQEIVLGVGGWQLLEKLGIEVDVCHLNEGHAAFAVLARAAHFARVHGVSFPVALCATRAGNVFTTHTPVDAAFDQFHPGLIAGYAKRFAELVGLSIEDLLSLGRRNPDDSTEPFNMAFLAMRGCCHVNGVSRLHGRVSKGLFRCLYPGCPQVEVPIRSITNGVHVPTWVSGEGHELWATAHRGEGSWFSDLEEAGRDLASVSDVELWDFRASVRNSLVHYVRMRLERQERERGAGPEYVAEARHVLDPNVLTVGFARRFTEYKRPLLILADEVRLLALLSNSERPVQFVVAGKAHPNDPVGKDMVRAMAQFCSRPEIRHRAVFLQDYDVTLAQHLTAGVDVWLNNPRRPAEACGTSGMKILVNGGLHFSSMDGWWDEAFTPEVGWALGDGDESGSSRDPRDAAELYAIIENEIVPAFYERNGEGVPTAWMQRIRASMTTLTPQFSADRMVQEYTEGAYLPAAAAYRQRAADGAALAKGLSAWQARLDDGWESMRFGELSVQGEAGQEREIVVQVYFGEIDPEAVTVELYADPVDPARDAPEVSALARKEAIHGAVNGFLYTGTLPAGRPDSDYTARLRPYHPAAFVPNEATRVMWRR